MKKDREFLRSLSFFYQSVTRAPSPDSVESALRREPWVCIPKSLCAFSDKHCFGGHKSSIANLESLASKSDKGAFFFIFQIPKDFWDSILFLSANG